jgi:peroxiredoxin
VVLAANFGEKAEKAKTFAEKWELSFPVLVDRRANVASQYSVVSLPVSLFIDSEGLVRERVFGGTLTAGTINQILQRLAPLHPKSPPSPRLNPGNEMA